MCRACASKHCRRFVLRTFSHRYPTACMSSGHPRILRREEAVVLKRRVQLGVTRSRLLPGALIRFRGAGKLVGRA